MILQLWRRWIASPFTSDKETLDYELFGSTKIDSWDLLGLELDVQFLRNLFIYVIFKEGRVHQIWKCLYLKEKINMIYIHIYIYILMKDIFIY